jgi:hypothetical protein
MRVPDAILLATIQSKNLYLDKKSKEITTSRVKGKYKLAGNILSELEQYFFNILTKNFSSCKSRLTIKIEEKHWEEKAEGDYLSEEVGYCDVTKYELIGKDDLVKKMRQYSFPYVARLCESKYRELQSIRNKAQKEYFISREVKNIITKGISPSIEELASKLGLD